MKALLVFLPSLAVMATGCNGDVTIGTGGDGGATGTTTASATTTATSTDTSTSTTPDDFTACNGPGQCMLAIAGCCAPCEYPELDAYAAVHVDKAAAYGDFICPTPTGCDDCSPGYNPNLFAYCDLAAGKCVAADARTHAVSACTGDEQCFLRAGTSCCQTCGEVDVTGVTAVSTTASPSLVELVCNPDTACPACVPQLPGPEEIYTYCGEDGHCSAIVIDK